MNKNKPIHTVPNSNGGWDNKQQGSDKVISHSSIKTDAVHIGRDQAMKNGTEHFVHNKNGQFGERNSYGNDPYPPKG